METLVKKLGSRFETTPSLFWTMHVHCALYSNFQHVWRTFTRGSRGWWEGGE